MVDENLVNRIVQSLYTKVAGMISMSQPRIMTAYITSVEPLEIQLQDGKILGSGFLSISSHLLKDNVENNCRKIPHMHQYDGITDETTPPNDEALSNAGGTVLPNPHHHTHTHDISLLITHDVHDGINAEDFSQINLFPALAIGDEVEVLKFNSNQFRISDRLQLSEENQAILDAANEKLNRNPSPVGGK